MGQPIRALAALALLALCPPGHAQTPAPVIKAEISQVASSATDAQITLAVTNTAPPSRLATDLTLTIRVAANGPFPAGVYPVTVHYPAQDNRYTGPVTADIPLGYTLSGVIDGGLVATDAAGQHLTYSVAALDGGATWATTFVLSRPLVDAPGGAVAAPAGGTISARPIMTAAPLTDAAAKQAMP